MRFLQVIFLFMLTFFFCCSEAKKEEEITVGFSQPTEGDAWRKAMHKEMEREVSFHPEIDLQVKDAKNSSAKQIEHINEFINQRVDLLVVSPNEAEPITPVVEKAFEAGIPVIIVDRKTNSSSYTAYVGANNYQIGKLAGEYVAKMLNGKGNIIEVWGLKGSTPAIDRHKGFLDGIKGYPDIQIVAEVPGEWEKEIAKERFPTVFTAHQEVDLVFAHNDMMAVGAYESIKGTGKADSLKFVGFDGLAGPNGGLQFVEDGILDATFLYPTGGEEIIKLAYDILHNRPFKRENILNTTVIDGRNVHIMQQQANKILGQEQSIERQQHRIDEQIELYNNQRALLYILSASLVVIIVLGALALQALKAKQEANKALVAKHQEVVNQRNEVALMAKKADKANEAKLKFFTNISHEFRTPLTLILGPVEDALQSNISTDLKKDMLLVKQNAVRLLRLVNQLMDFRKVENKKMKLRAYEKDIVRFVKEVASSFERLAKKRNISFKVQTELRELNVYFDADKLDKVLFNLLSNAFKFTKDGGKITLAVALSDNYEGVDISVEDNGKGMSSVEAAHAFDRFYSGDTSSSLSTGLGLALSKQFIKLHRGEIAVVSEEKKGARFMIMLPLGSRHLNEDEIIADTGEHLLQMAPGVLDCQELYSEDYTPDEEAKLKEHTILLIEDNKDLREFLKKRLEREFNVVEAPQGIFGLNQAFETVPDLIISDVMMPGQSGLEITSILKNDLRTSHIPVVLLTAKDTIEQKIEGAQSGADLYITKPFSYLYLLERVKGLIKNREMLKEHYSSEVSVDTKATPAPPKQLDKKFLNEVMAVVEKNISNPNLNANSIAHDLGMSRVQVYRKMKALLGYSVNDYVVKARLKKARHLLLHSDKNISEIAYEVGFSSPAYFSTAFKSHFDMSPSDFKAEKSAKEKSA
ncbi:hybrid sensor histidine kinase/response regulator transcription factor [Pontibacter pamirensis]|uniref:hybrid sensor histidine kinase/response regulator transcription factor n=1 Tax=Pontibacter pamirensis TaxID=2562824 RepID=UPI00138A2CB8|nr:substrate-binding domain-containing protein [Pontibacter pamirensis]